MIGLSFIALIEWSNLSINMFFVCLLLIPLFVSLSVSAGPLSWPVRCEDGSERNCLHPKIGYADIDEQNLAFNCGPPGYEGHRGTDLVVRQEQINGQHEAIAAAPGEVMFVHDGKYDNCPNAEHPDCNRNPPGPLQPGYNHGTTTCSALGPYCNGSAGSCFWCFTGGNYVVLRHEGIPHTFATYYAHLRTGSVTVKKGDSVERGDVLGYLASSGNSTGHHLHFEVWDKGFYKPVDPWPGPCSSNAQINYWQTKEEKLANPTHVERVQEKRKSFSQFD